MVPHEGLLVVSEINVNQVPYGRFVHYAYRLIVFIIYTYPLYLPSI